MSRDGAVTEGDLRIKVDDGQAEPFGPSRNDLAILQAIALASFAVMPGFLLGRSP